MVGRVAEGVPAGPAFQVMTLAQISVRLTGAP
jgi:hypothetical protein